MQIPEPIKFKGVPGSPYTRKMLAYLRFRHIRYEVLLDDEVRRLGLPAPKVNLLPTFYLPNSEGELEAVVDSTPLIRRFEQTFDARRTIPREPALAFLNFLIEDYADEWLTKAMFHYRWYYDADIDKAARLLPRWNGIQASEQSLQRQGKVFADRQVARLHVVGSNNVTAPVIEDSYKRFLPVMDQLIERQKFVLGSRPSSADFAIYAQMTQLAKFDPTPAAICLSLAPRVSAWTDLVDDLSGQTVDADWVSVDGAQAALAPLLAEIGRFYTPVMLANATALQEGRDHFETSVDGRPWQQPTFAYQGKCVHRLRQEYAALPEPARAIVQGIIAGSGCEPLLENV